MRNNNDNNIKVKMLGMMLSAFFFGILLLFDRITASATIVNITFGEEAIAVNQEETFKVPVNIKADGNIGYYEVQIKYDVNRMQYVSGADAEDNGIITLRGEGWGGEISYGNIEFKAISGGSAGMKVMEASIYNNDEENSLYEPEFLPELNIEINGDDNDYLPFFEQVKIDDRIQTTLDTYGIKTDAPIVGSISKGSERLYVVDMTDYTPNLQIWNYTLVTDLFMGQNMTYISDSARNVRVIPVMNAKGAYSIYAIDTQTNEVYPIQIATEGGIDGKKYYIMSLEACSSLPEEMTIPERESDTIFYGIDVNGIGDYYRYTADGKLETWANSLKNEKKQELISVLKVILIILGASAVIALITLLIVKRRGVANKLKEQFVYVKDGVVDRKQYLFVISQLTSREIKRKYARSYLGIIW
nr:cohesin domain-containing protein [Lachnospiraceae bacterium]